MAVPINPRSRILNPSIRTPLRNTITARRSRRLKSRQPARPTSGGPVNRLPVSLARACALWCAVSLTGVSALAQEPAPAAARRASSAGQRPRRVHGEGARPARRQSPDARPVRPRRDGVVRDPRSGPLAAASHTARLHVVRPGRHARPQPGTVQRGQGRRRGARQATRRTGFSASAGVRNARPRRRTRRTRTRRKRGSRAKSRSPPRACRFPPAGPRSPSRVSSRKPISWTSSSSPATTTWPAGNSSKASRW